MSHSDMVSALYLTLGTAIASLVTALAAWLRAEATNLRVNRNTREITKLKNGTKGEEE